MMPFNLSTTDIAIVLVGGLLVHQLTTQLLLWRRKRAFTKQYGCQDPPRYPAGIFGLHHFSKIMKAAKEKKIIEFLTARYRPGFNTFLLNLLGKDIIQTIEPENIKTILASGFKDFELGPVRKEAFHAMLGEGIFTLDGKGWEYSRTLLRPQFSREQVADTFMLDTHVSRMLDLMEKAGEGVPVDLQPWIFSLTLDSATEFLFGESCESLLKGESDRQGFAYAFNEGQQWILWRLRWRGITSYIEPKGMKEVNASVHRFVDHYVNMALNREKYPLPAEAQGKYIFLDAVVQTNKNPKALRDQMLNILLAGRDTTAGLIGWTVYLLARHPVVYNKLRAELETAFGTGEPGVWKLPTFTGLKEVVYLRYVLNEVLRLFPSVPLNSRDAVRDTTLPTGGGPDGRSPIFVPAGRRIQYSVYAMQRRKDIYGPDADKFRPERWGDGSKIGRGWEYLPFNGGPRICLGQQYALTEAGFTIARILQTYERIEPVNPNEEPPIEANLTMSPQKCLVRLYPVKR